MSSALNLLAWTTFCELSEETQQLGKSLATRGSVEEPELLPSGYLAIRVRSSDRGRTYDGLP